GRLVMSWNVSLDGQVSDVSVRSKEFADLPLVGCLTKQIGTWTFPKHEVQHAPIDFPFPF
ncbi:MAG: AgmX/PglI C-terminal domain-containing protein, partial [Myxococcaceae bacterium]